MKTNKIFFKLNTLFLGLIPGFVFAQQGPASNVKTLLDFLIGVFNKWLIPIFTTLGLVYLIIAVIGFIGANEDTARRNEKKQQIFWGIIALFVILTVWSLVNVVGNTFGILRGGALSN